MHTGHCLLGLSAIWEWTAPLTRHVYVNSDIECGQKCVDKIQKHGQTTFLRHIRCKQQVWNCLCVGYRE